MIYVLQVEVEVVPSLPDQDDEASPSRAGTDRSLSAYFDKIKLGRHGSGNETQKTKTGDVNESSESTSGMPSRTMSLDDVEDAGWDSDQSHPDPGSTSSHHLTPSNSILIHPHSHKRKPHHQKAAPIRARRRSLIRRSSSHGYPSTSGQDAAEHHRGRISTADTKVHPRPSTAPNSRLSSRISTPHATRPNSLRNLRLEHVKGHESREHSPSRSIRFADDEYRSSVIDASEDSHPTNERNQVTFDLPPRKP